MCISPISFALLALTGMHLNFLGIHVGSGDPTVPHTLMSKRKAINEELQDAIKGYRPIIVLMNGTFCSVHPPAGYLGKAETAYTVLIKMVLSGHNMSHVYTGGGAQVYTRGDRLLTERSKLFPETRVANTETGVVITTAWDWVMRTTTSDRIRGATGRLNLEDARAEGVRFARSDSAEDLLSHLEKICQCNASDVALHVVGVDTESDASDQNRTDRHPVLRLIGLCYTDSTHHTIMISVGMKIVGGMALHDSSHAKAQL